MSNPYSLTPWLLISFLLGLFFHSLLGRPLLAHSDIASSNIVRLKGAAFANANPFSLTRIWQALTSFVKRERPWLCYALWFDDHRTSLFVHFLVAHFLLTQIEQTLTSFAKGGCKIKKKPLFYGALGQIMVGAGAVIALISLLIFPRRLGEWLPKLLGGFLVRRWLNRLPAPWRRVPPPLWPFRCGCPRLLPLQFG